MSTKDGPIPAQNLSPGTVLLTDANEPIVINGISETHLSFARLQQNRALAPIRFEPSSAAPHYFHQAVLLAPDTPVHVEPTGEMTIRAAQLANWGTIRPVLPEEGITYLTLTVSRPATLEVAGVRLRLGATASADTIGQSAQSWRQDDKRVFRPIR